MKASWAVMQNRMLRKSRHMNDIFYKQAGPVISIVFSVLIFCTVVFLSNDLNVLSRILIALVAAAQILISLDFIRCLKRDLQKEREKEEILRDQKKENNELHIKHVKQKFEQRMQRYDEDALARKKKQQKRMAENVPDPEDLKKILNTDLQNESEKKAGE